MTRLRLNKALTRSALYLVAGVLPALFFALLSLILLMSGSLWGVLLSLAAWLGCLGLILATLQQPRASTSSRLQWTCLLLVMGILAISPLLLVAIADALKIPTLSALVAGPPLVALHYLYCALPLFGREQWRNAGLAVTFTSLCLVLYWLRAKPPTQVIFATAQTNEVSLVVEGNLHGPGPVMGLHYLRKLPYQAIHYQGRIYRPLHRDAWVSMPGQEQSVRYLVHEQINSNPDAEDWPEQIVWSVQDQNTGTLMARRELWRNGTREWSRDTPSGWQGDNAKQFIASVLKPTPGAPQSPGYPEASFHSEQQAASTSRSRAELETHTNGCNGDIELLRDGALSQYVESRSAGWRFESEWVINQVFCLASNVYILSAVSPGELRVDQLSREGRGQTHFRIRPWPRAIHEGMRHQYVYDLRKEPDGINLQIDFLSKWPTDEQDAAVARTLKLHIKNDL